MTHPILASHPAYQAHMEEVAKFDEAEAAWRERTRKAREDYEAGLAEYRSDKAVALLEGREPPREPQPPADGGPDEARLFLDQRQALRYARRDLLADLAPEVEAAARARMEEIVDEARPLLAELESLADESGQLVAVVRSCLLSKERSENVPAGHGRGDRMRHTVTVLDLAAAVIDGFSLFDPMAPEPARLIAASFEAPEEPKPSRPLPSQNRSPSPLQVKG
jgi:hypothetical protein